MIYQESLKFVSCLKRRIENQQRGFIVERKDDKRRLQEQHAHLRILDSREALGF